VLITHDVGAAADARRVIRMHDGRIANGAVAVAAR
jgi:predicted ABC-type transport system involved in lysophospholipase L1 biosynthesis ATPase subunit